VLFYIILKSEQGVAGFVLACIIHLQLYMLLYDMMWCALHTKEIVQKMNKLHEANSGTYSGLELRGVEDAIERRPTQEKYSLGAERQAPVITLEEDRLEGQQAQEIGDLLNTEP